MLRLYAQSRRRTLLSGRRALLRPRGFVRTPRRRRVPSFGDLDVGDLRRIVWAIVARVAGHPGNLLDYVDVLALPENRVMIVEPRRGDIGDEELRAIRTGAAVRHRQPARLVEGEVGAELVLELVAGIAGAGAQRVAGLNHEVRDDAMEDDAVVQRHALHHFAGLGVRPFFLASRKADKVGDGFRGLVGKQRAG